MSATATPFGLAKEQYPLVLGNQKPIEIVRVIRRMRGGCQSFLVVGSDGHAYVAKFAGNPQGTRALINESVALYVLRYLGASTPEGVILQLNDRCEGRDQLYFSTNRR